MQYVTDLRKYNLNSTELLYTLLEQLYLNHHRRGRIMYVFYHFVLKIVWTRSKLWDEIT